MRRLGSLSALGVALLIAPGCGERFPSYRFRMTVEVETPEGLRTGFSVIEVQNFRGSGFPGPEAGGLGFRVRGEAVAVDLGSRGTLFALLSARDDPDRAAGIAPTALLAERVDKGGTTEAWGNNLRAIKRRAEPAELPPSFYPMLVRFQDMKDPRTVQEVSSGELSSFFGPGVQFKRIIISLTDEPVTTGISSRFPWWEEYKDTNLDGVRLNDSSGLANSLNRYDFQRVN